MSRIPIKQGISSAVVTNIPDTWNAAWFRYFIINFLANADVRNSVNPSDVLVTGNINVPGTINTLDGMPPVFLGDDGGFEEPMIVPGPPGPTSAPIVGLRISDATSITSTLTADTQLVLNISTVGTYSLEIFLTVFEGTGSPIGGFQFDLGTGTAVLSNLKYGVVGFSNGITSKTTPTSVLVLSATSSSPTWIMAKGVFTVSTIGSLGLRWAQSAISSALPTTLQTGAYIMATRIG